MLSNADRLECSYGENAWQAPTAFVSTSTNDPLALGRFELLEGASLSYNNLVEVDRQLQTIAHVAAAFDLAGISAQAVAVGTKHGNACGAAVAGTPAVAIQRMLTGDTRAIFGGSVLLGFDVDSEAAETLVSYQSPTRRLLDVVVAAAFTEEAIEVLARKRGKCQAASQGGRHGGGRTPPGRWDLAVARRSVERRRIAIEL